MKKKLLTSSIAVATLFCASAATQAENIKLASIGQVDGKVMVNKGKGYVAAKPGTPLNDNDRVITLNDSSASVVYSDGCVANLKSNNLLTLDKDVACSKQAVSTQQPLRFAAIGGTANDAGGGGSGGSGGSSGNPGGGPLGGNTVLLGTTGIIAAIIYSISDD